MIFDYIKSIDVYQILFSEFGYIPYQKENCYLLHMWHDLRQKARIGLRNTHLGKILV